MSDVVWLRAPSGEPYIVDMFISEDIYLKRVLGASYIGGYALFIMKAYFFSLIPASKGIISCVQLVGERGCHVITFVKLLTDDIPEALTQIFSNKLRFLKIAQIKAQA